LQGAGLVNALAAGKALLPTTAELISQDQTTAPHHTVALTTFFSAADVMGDPITKYNVWQGATVGAHVGAITNAEGDLPAPLQSDTVTSLDGITYHGGDASDTDRIWVQAYGAGQWSNWVQVEMRNVGAHSATDDSIASQINSTAQLAQALASFAPAESVTASIQPSISSEPMPPALLAAHSHA